MNRKDHYSSKEPLVISAIIFYYRKSVKKKKNAKELNNKSKRYKHKHTFLYSYNNQFSSILYRFETREQNETI